MSETVEKNGNGNGRPLDERSFRLSSNTLLGILALLASGNLLKSFNLASEDDVKRLDAKVESLDAKVDKLTDGSSAWEYKFQAVLDRFDALRAEVESIKRAQQGGGK